MNKTENSNIKMTTDEAKKLIEMLKNRVTETSLEFPKLGSKLEFEVMAKREGNKFIININRASIDKNKCTYQGRTALNNIPILRLDITNSFHRNPDGTKIEGNHLHIYTQNAGMGEAIPFNIEDADLFEYCMQFFKKFNLIQDNYGIIYQMEL